MQVLADAAEEVLEDVLGGGRAARELALHHRDELHDYLGQLVAVEQVRHGARRQHAVQVLEERLLLHVLLDRRFSFVSFFFGDCLFRFSWRTTCLPKWIVWKMKPKTALVTRTRFFIAKRNYFFCLSRSPTSAVYHVVR